MAEERSSAGNLDLNLHPDPESGPDPARMIELSQLFTTSANGAALPVRRGSIAGAGRVSEVVEKFEDGSTLMKKGNVTEEKKDAEKSVCNADSFFDCSICLDLSKDPVLTKCGHLYCWACLYLWLQYSWAKECPTCKADASVTTLTPLFGRGKHRRDSEVSDPMIPPRPQPRCISFETSLWRGVSTPTEMVSQFEREFCSTGERRNRPLLNSFMTSRGLRAEQNLSSEALVTPTVTSNIFLSEALVTPAGFYQNSNIFPENEGANGIQRSFIAERLMDPYWMTHGFRRNQVQNSTPTVGVAENDSEASRFGVINFETEIDTDEIESMLTVPASPSVGIHENGSRVPDVDNEDSRPLRRRRLT